MTIKRCARCTRLPHLAYHAPRANRRSASFRLEAQDLGRIVNLFAAESYHNTALSGDPAALDVEHARQLRDWLTTWLEREIGPT